MNSQNPTLGARMPEQDARLVRGWAAATGRTVSEVIRQIVVPAARAALARLAVAPEGVVSTAGQGGAALARPGVPLEDTPEDSQAEIPR